MPRGALSAEGVAGPFCQVSVFPAGAVAGTEIIRDDGMGDLPYPFTGRGLGGIVVDSMPRNGGV
jgi:hypothetical protein